MGRVELPYGPYESPVLPLDYIAIAILSKTVPEFSSGYFFVLLLGLEPRLGV